MLRINSLAAYNNRLAENAARLIAIFSSLPSSILVGVFTNGGVIVGGFYGRKTQYRLWRLERRSEEYAKPWLVYKDCWDAVRAYQDSKEFKEADSSTRPQRISALTAPFHRQLRIARLFASNRVRTRLIEFGDLFAQACHGKNYEASKELMGPVNAMMNNLGKELGVTSLEYKLQELFERDLRKP